MLLVYATKRKTRGVLLQLAICLPMDPSVRHKVALGPLVVCLNIVKFRNNCARITFTPFPENSPFFSTFPRWAMEDCDILSYLPGPGIKEARYIAHSTSFFGRETGILPPLIVFPLIL